MADLGLESSSSNYKSHGLPYKVQQPTFWSKRHLNEKNGKMLDKLVIFIFPGREKDWIADRFFFLASYANWRSGGKEQGLSHL